MILRKPAISEQARAIGVPARPVVPARSPALSQLAPEAEATAHCDAQPLASLLSEERQILPPREATLSFEAVAAWLAVQDAQTRAACASMLCDELTEVHERAKTEGFTAGKVEVLALAERDQKVARALLENIAKTAAAEFQRESESLAQMCVDIVAEAFTKIAGAILPTREATIGAIGEVLKRVKDDRDVKIRVCSEDLQAGRIDAESLKASMPGRQITVLADARVELGGCIVESKLGNLDGRLEVQLRELFETLKAAKASGVDAP